MSVPPQEKNATGLSKIRVKGDSHGRNTRNHFLLRLSKGILVWFVLMFSVANLVLLWSNDELNSSVWIYRASYLSTLPLPIPMELVVKNGTTDFGDKQEEVERDQEVSITPICQATPWPVVLPSKIYFCGNDRQDLLELVYPEFASIPRTWLTQQSIRNATQHDVLVFGSCGHCPGFPRQPRLLEVLQKSFPGMVFHINGEAKQGDIWDQFASYQWSLRHPQQQQSPTNESNGSVPVVPAPPRRNFHVGYAADSNYSVRVFFASQVVAEASHEMQQWLFDPLQKPRNTGEAFMLYTASNCVRFREQAFREIALAVSKIPLEAHNNRPTVLHKGAKCGGKLAPPVSPWKPKDWHGNWPSNYESYRHYRFCLVLENKYQPGYITEKIVLAFWAGCIPIYYGTQEVFDIFNPRAFVYYDPGRPQQALAQIVHLETNQTAYDEVMKEPILAHGYDTIDRYFSLQDGIGRGSFLKQKIRDMVCAQVQDFEQ